MHRSVVTAYFIIKVLW